MANEYTATVVINTESTEPSKTVRVPASGETVTEQVDKDENPSDDSAFIQTYSYLT